MSLGETICRLRTEKHMSQGDLADALDVSRQSISKWETDRSVPELDKLVKLSQIFGVSLDTLVLGQTDESTAQEAPQQPEQERGRPLTGARLAGIILLCFGGLAWLLLTVMGGLLTGLILASPFLLCGLICLLARSHAGLWCAWAVYFLVDTYLRFATGISWSMVFLTPYFEPSMNYARLAIAWCQLAVAVLLIVVTAVRLRRKPLEPTRRNKIALLVGWAVFVALRLIPLPLIQSMVFYAVVDGVRLVFFTVLVTATARYVRTRCAHG